MQVAGATGQRIPITNGKKQQWMVLKTKNRLLQGYSVPVIGKTGFTRAAGRCFAGYAERNGRSLIVVVEEIGDLWALERAGVVNGLYHVLGGHLSPLDGIGPDRLNIARLVERAAGGEVQEIVLALNATVEGQSTAHYLTEQLAPTGVVVSRLAQGVPIGGELDYLDEGTLAAAIKARKRI